MLLEIHKGTVSQNGQTVLDHFDFYIKGTEKIAIVGRNGSGKSTLLEVLSGEKELDADEKNPSSGLRRARNLTVSVLGQQAVRNPDERVEEAVFRIAESAGKAGQAAGWIEKLVWEAGEPIGEDTELAAGKEPANVKSEEEKSAERRSRFLQTNELNDFEQQFNRQFTELGFSMEDREKQLGDFSGGEQTKIMLILNLLAEPDILLLDEPTNHLDVDTLEWLERQIRAYPNAVVTVSHDRFFIDRTADVVWEVTGGQTICWPGNYTHYRQEKAAAYARQLKAYEQQQEEIHRLDELIEKFRHKPRKAAFARSRRKILDRMERIPKPDPDDAVIHTGAIVPARPGSKNVVVCEHLQIGYDHPVRELSYRIRRGQKIGIFGPNGTGKSTFLKTIVGKIPPIKGKCRIGEQVDIAYFDQMAADIHSEKNVFDWFHDQFPSLTGEEVRKTLAGFLFHAEQMGQKVSNLSGGEKARLVLAELLQNRPNFLVLDEPTNNMDIPAKETLESIFRSFEGTVLFVSHDRYFLSHVAESLLLFEAGTSAVQYYPFGYAHYLEHRDREKNGASPADLRAVENQKLLDDLKAVPKAERFRLREMSTDEATEDWLFSLNRPEKQASEEAFRASCDELDAFLLSDWMQADENEWADNFSHLYKKREDARARWTKSLLDWYDLWEQYRELGDESS